MSGMSGMPGSTPAPASSVGRASPSASWRSGAVGEDSPGSGGSRASGAKGVAPIRLSARTLR